MMKCKCEAKTGIGKPLVSGTPTLCIQTAERVQNGCGELGRLAILFCDILDTVDFLEIGVLSPYGCYKKA
jgi:hypothetical protein